jgi:cell division protein FtsL
VTRAIDGTRSEIRVTPRPAARPSGIRWESLEFVSTIALGALILVGALLYVWQQIHVVRLGYEIEGLREEQAALVQENKALKLELGQLRSLKRVEEIARQRLGMVTPKPGQVVLIPDSAIQ